MPTTDARPGLGNARGFRCVVILSATVLLVGLSSRSAWGQFGMELDAPPIQYRTAPLHDPISRLQQRIDQHQVQLEYDHKLGYLPSILRELQVSVSSQLLVFSKTSFQREQISPRTPRAIYFNDEVYVGWVQRGEVVEISNVDPELGAVFYTLKQQATEKPTFTRQTDSCLLCHDSAMTHGVPGHLVRSVFSDSAGLPILSAGTHLTTYQSPLKERWGGWYVTGTHGRQLHMGNSVVKKTIHPEEFDFEAGANVTDLSSRCDTQAYCAPDSDLVALMVLEHQTPTHNLITLANYEGRVALRDEAVLHSLDKEPSTERSPSIQRRFEHSAERLLKNLLFVDEAKLDEPLQGTSAFVNDFAARGPRDARGRSLREFDLQHRLFKYPCSYLIYSAPFDSLPQPVKEVVFRRMWEVLTGQDQTKDYAHLSGEDRQAILEILRETKLGLPAYWTAEAPTGS